MITLSRSASLGQNGSSRLNVHSRVLLPLGLDQDSIRANMAGRMRT